MGYISLLLVSLKGWIFPGCNLDHESGKALVCDMGETPEAFQETKRKDRYTDLWGVIGLFAK